MLVERCFHALDHDRIEFHDITGRCAVASAGAAAVGLGVCVLAAPEIVVGAIIITGVVVVGFAIKDALDAHELKWTDPKDARPVPETRPVPEVKPVPETKPIPQEPSPKQKPKQGPKGPDLPPVGPTETSERDRRPECKPVPVKHRGGNNDHNKCADRIPFNSFPGRDVRVNGKDYDGLQLIVRTLWEVKTNDIEAYNPFIRRVEINKQIDEARRERALAAACGFDFRIGVRSKTHKEALDAAAADLRGLIEVMDWC
ncbi:DUF6310 domain-containing protein [Archangium violaceum]|uniref:DUF6310 domain-containing protein n=1 Tax=Archangium violaceum TaxID=83451 RepID=UPI0037C06D65